MARRSVLDNDLLQYTTVKDWLSRLKPRSRRNYVSCFRFWLEWLVQHKTFDIPTVPMQYESVNGIELNCHIYNPDSLVKLRSQDLSSSDVKTRHRFEQLAATYYMQCQEQMAPWSSSGRLKAVRSFFKYNYQKLDYLPGELRVRPESVKTKHIPSQDDVKTLYGFCESWRDKAILLLMYQSGLTPVDVRRRNLTDIPDPYREYDKPVYFEYVRSKTGTKVRTCVSHEFLYAIRKYLEIRKKPLGEVPLFKGRRGKRLRSLDVTKVILSAQRKAKSVTRFVPKNLRDGYKDALRSGQVDGDIQDWMMGHKGSTGKDYGQPDIVGAYLRAWPFLRITEQETVVAGEQEQRIQALEGEVEYLKESLVKIRDELREISQL